MEFNEKLFSLRKEKGLTQEELARSLYVSRTAISKWESGRGYPSIDSLKEISKFFSLSIDELIRPEEIIIAAKREKEDSLRRYTAFICSLLDIFLAALLFIPVFGNGANHTAVSLIMLTGMEEWIRTLVFALVIITVLNGVLGIVLSRLERGDIIRIVVIAGIALTALCAAVFILTRQPYAGIICFAALLIKGATVLSYKP